MSLRPFDQSVVCMDESTRRRDRAWPPARGATKTGARASRGGTHPGCITMGPCSGKRLAMRTADGCSAAWLGPRAPCPSGPLVQGAIRRQLQLATKEAATYVATIGLGHGTCSYQVRPEGPPARMTRHADDLGLCPRPVGHTRFGTLVRATLGHSVPIGLWGRGYPKAATSSPLCKGGDSCRDRGHHGRTLWWARLGARVRVGPRPMAGDIVMTSVAAAAAAMLSPRLAAHILSYATLQPLVLTHLAENA